MKARPIANNRLIGFGWAGWLYLSVFLAILIPHLLGVDLRYELMKLIQTVFGIDAVINFVAKLPFAMFAIGQPTICITTCVWILIAFALSPYHHNLIVGIASLVLCAGWYWVCITYGRDIERLFIGNGANWSSLRSYYILDGVGYVIVATAIVYLTRSWIVFAGWSVAFAVSISHAIFALNSYSIGGSYYDPTVFEYFDIGTYSWFALVYDMLILGSLVTWALLERRRVIGKDLCTHCGYDLAGLAANAACPECGNAPSDTALGPTSTRVT